MQNQLIFEKYRKWNQSAKCKLLNDTVQINLLLIQWLMRVSALLQECGWINFLNVTQDLWCKDTSLRRREGGNASFELSSSSCDIIILPHRISVKTMFFKASSFLSKLLQRLSSTTFRQSQNYPSKTQLLTAPQKIFFVTYVFLQLSDYCLRCHAITIQMIFVSCHALHGSA